MKDSPWKKLEDIREPQRNFSRDGVELPFLSSMVTVSLAHFMRNLAVGISRQLYGKSIGTYLTSFILNYFSSCSEDVGIQTRPSRCMGA